MAFFGDRHHLVLLGFDGSRSSLLALLFLGLPRLPFVASEMVSWRDNPDVTALLRAPARLLYELAQAWRDVSPVHTSSCCRVLVDGRVLVVTRLTHRSRYLQARLPDRIELELTPEIGPQSLRSFRGDQLLTSARLEDRSFFQLVQSDLGAPPHAPPLTPVVTAGCPQPGPRPEDLQQLRVLGYAP